MHQSAHTRTRKEKTTRETDLDLTKKTRNKSKKIDESIREKAEKSYQDDEHSMDLLLQSFGCASLALGQVGRKEYESTAKRETEKKGKEKRSEDERR